VHYSLPKQIKIMSSIFEKIKKIDHDPFEPEHKLDMFSLIALQKLMIKV
jgi:hypothetical protein